MGDGKVAFLFEDQSGFQKSYFAFESCINS